jgi:hypothetical protein
MVEKPSPKETKSSHSFADLCGKWDVPGGISEEEIDAVLYRLTPEWEDEIATLPKQEPTETNVQK